MRKLLSLVFFSFLLEKFIMIYFLSSSVPYNDIWNGVIKQTLLPYTNHTMTWKIMFAPYNEHRMLFQRIYDISFVYCLR